MKTTGIRACGIALVVSGLSFALCGCLWGVVRDSQTSQPVSGARVTFYDAAGNSGTTTTGADGLYAFDGAERAVPLAGPVAFQVSAAGYQTLGSQRNVQYDDNAAGAWEIQSFSLTAATGAAPPGGG
jgi:hypothetical protein